MRRRSSRSEVVVSFECLEWPTEMRRGWGPIYSPCAFMTVGGVRRSDLSNLDQICPMGDSNWLEFGWVGYIRWGSNISDQGEVTWYPMKIE
jgi:hypothetical protein